MGESETESIYGQSGQVPIKCNDVKFNDYVCLKQSDFESLIIRK